jgi:hypothetical protein
MPSEIQIAESFRIRALLLRSEAQQPAPGFENNIKKANPNFNFKLLTFNLLQ